ncbi:MAG TPA: hypothetical protein VIK93_09435 [Limnochordales bacterium]
MAFEGQTALTVRLRPGDIVSRCGLLCNTCSAYITGACPGCPSLETGECVLRDCADLKGTSCLDCQAPSCHHFEAYTWRRRLMQEKAKHFLRLARSLRRAGAAPGAGAVAGCGGGCGCAARANGAGAGASAGAAGATGAAKAAGCGGCAAAGGCPAARLAGALAAAAGELPMPQLAAAME